MTFDNVSALAVLEAQAAMHSEPSGRRAQLATLAGFLGYLDAEEPRLHCGDYMAGYRLAQGKYGPLKSPEHALAKLSQRMTVQAAMARETVDRHRPQAEATGNDASVPF